MCLYKSRNAEWEGDRKCLIVKDSAWNEKEKLQCQFVWKERENPPLRFGKYNHAKVTRV